MVIVPLVQVRVPECEVLIATAPELQATSKSLKLIIEVLPVPPVMDIPVPIEVVILVFPKFAVKVLPPAISIPVFEGLDKLTPFVEVKVPVIFDKAIGLKAVFEVIEVKVAETAPVAKLRLPPFPLSIISEAVSVPKLVPEMS